MLEVTRDRSARRVVSRRAQPDQRRAVILNRFPLLAALALLTVVPALVPSSGGQALAGEAIISTVAGGGPDGLPATSASLNFPRALALDGQGNLYLPTQDLRVYKVDSAGNFTAIAGTGVWGDSGDGGPSLAARFRFPWGIAADSAGNLFIADGGSHRIRRVDHSTGLITAAAGSGIRGFCGDGGPAIQACLDQPAQMSLDAAGNLFITDWTNDRIRRVDAITGRISTVAGNGVRGFQGDGGQAMNASLNLPLDVAVDAAGNLFIADSGNHRIRRVDAASRVITTIAGTGTAGFSGDGGPASSARLNDPDGIALDSAGNIYIADFRNHRVRMVNGATGIITTVAGVGNAGALGDGGPATTAFLYGPTDVAIDPDGNLRIAQLLGFRIRQVDVQSGLISTVAGTGESTFCGDGFAATAARLFGPRAVALDGEDNILVTDTYNRRLRRIDALTGLITTVACAGGSGFGGDGGPALAARCYPHGVAVDSAGNIFIADVDLSEDLPESNNRIRRVDAQTGVITTYAGNGEFGSTGDGGPAANARLGNPGGIFLDPDGDLFIADNWNSKVRVVDAGTTVITTVAGTGIYGFSGDGGPATLARLATPLGVTLDESGNLYIADTENHRVRRVDATSRIITTVVGNGVAGYSGDGGPATSASLDAPTAVAVDRLGHLLIADTLSHRVRFVDLATGFIETLAGDGVPEFAGDGGPAALARLASPTGLAVRANGDILIADRDNDRIRAVVAPNDPPVAEAGQDFSSECASEQGGTVDLDGSASSDPDSTPGTNDDITLFEWIEDFGLPGERSLGEGERITLTLSLGEHLITLRLSDRAGATGTDEIVVSIVDTTPPVLSVAALPSALWPPDHDLVPVTIQTQTADLCGPVSLTLESVTSSEPDDAPGGGDGSTTGDIEGAAAGTADFAFHLRAEREGAGPGRLYTATYAALDGSGNRSFGDAGVMVPHDRGGATDALQIELWDTPAGTLVGWNDAAGATLYSVVRGLVSSLMESETAIHLGSLQCIQGPSPATSTLGSEDPVIPPHGEAFFYLVQYIDAIHGTLGEETTAKPRVGLVACP
jgi:sugar lactone lactonase YvrE